MSEHTPGQWRYLPNIGHVVSGPSCVRVCQMHPEDTPADFTDANARLIAAAPELLEACQHAARSCHHPACKCHGEYSANPELYCTCHVQKARAAIAKAEVQLDRSSTIQTIRSGGLWGVESDSDRAYLQQVQSEQLSELFAELKQIGFSESQINKAFENVEEK